MFDPIDLLNGAKQVDWSLKLPLTRVTEFDV